MRSIIFATAGQGAYSDPPNTQPVKMFQPDKWSEGMQLIHEDASGLGRNLPGTEDHVWFVHCDMFGLRNR